jgi:hypothetical protein
VQLPRVLRRAGRRTNAALLALCVGAFFSGWVGFAVGTPVPATLATVAHGLFGLGVVGLIPWKSAIVGRARAIPVAGWLLMVLVVVCLVAGFVQFFVGYGFLLGLSPIQVHVGAALVSVPLFAWHVLRRRPQRWRRADVSRRMLLRTGLWTAAAGVAYAGVVGVAGRTRGGAGRVATGSGRLDADAIPATIWLLDRVPTLDAATHRVGVAGQLLSLTDLERLASPVRARLDCTSGWYAEATWTGARLSDLLPGDRLAAAASIRVTSVTGYSRLFPAAEATGLWLATRVEGQPLSAGTGSPVRLVAPHRRGFWWVKWVRSVELTDQPPWAQSPFPPQ